MSQSWTMFLGTRKFTPVLVSRCVLLVVFQMMTHGGDTQVAGGPVKVVLLGHSYVQHLSEYAGQSLTTAHLGMSDIQIQFVCRAGMTLWPNKPGKCVRDHLPVLSASHDAAIILHIRGNDLVQNVSASEVTGEILQLVRDTTHDCHCPMYVTQLVTWRKHSEKVHNELVS